MRSKPESNFIMSYLFSRFSDVFRLWCNTSTPGVCVWVCVSERVSSVYFSPYWRRWLTTIGKKTKQFSNWNAILFSFFHFWRFVIFFFYFNFIEGDSCHRWKLSKFSLEVLGVVRAAFLFPTPPLVVVIVDLRISWWTTRTKTLFYQRKKFPGEKQKPSIKMAMVDGRPAQYGISLKQLREVMELRGREAVEQLRHYGGVQELCKKLYTSPTEGKRILNAIAKFVCLFFEYSSFNSFLFFLFVPFNIFLIFFISIAEK